MPLPAASGACAAEQQLTATAVLAAKKIEPFDPAAREGVQRILDQCVEGGQLHRLHRWEVMLNKMFYRERRGSSRVPNYDPHWSLSPPVALQHAGDEGQSPLDLLSQSWLGEHKEHSEDRCEAVDGTL